MGQDDTTRCGLVVALFKKIRMSASPHKDDQPRFVAVIELVGQKKVAADVTFPVTGPLATQGGGPPILARAVNHWRPAKAWLP